MYFYTRISDVPLLNLALGKNMNPADIEEGDDVYFDCIIDANPLVYKVIWKHNVSKFITFFNNYIKMLI